MAKLSIVAGATSQSVNVFIQNSGSTTGAGLTGFAPAGGALLSGMVCYYSFSGTNAASVVQALTVPATVGAAFSAGQIVEIDATHMPGVARLDLPNAALASGKGRSVVVMISGGTNVAPCVLEIELTGVDNQDGVHFGLTSLPNTAVTTNGSLITSGAGTDQLTVSGGVASADAKKINAVATTSVTTVNANIGSTQPLNFTGTGASALVKGDATDIGGTAAASATVGTVTNLTNAPTAGDFTATMKTSLNAATPASVTGAVGSVTGNVGGNVAGSVGSVTAAVTVGTNNDKTGYSLATGQLFIKKNTQITITFPMTDSTTHAPKAGLGTTITCQRSIDGAAIGACANANTELSGGLYSLVLAAADVNGTMITLILSAAGADTRFIGLVTQP